MPEHEPGMDDRQALVERYLAAYNRFDVDGMLATLSEDVRFENWSGAELTASSAGSAAFRALAEEGKAMFSAREQRITAWRRHADALVAAIAWYGVLAVDVPAGPPAGTRVELQGQSEFRFAGGRIAAIVDRG